MFIDFVNNFAHLVIQFSANSGRRHKAAKVTQRTASSSPRACQGKPKGAQGRQRDSKGRPMVVYTATRYPQSVDSLFAFIKVVETLTFFVLLHNFVNFIWFYMGIQPRKMKIRCSDCVKVGRFCIIDQHAASSNARKPDNPTQQPQRKFLEDQGPLTSFKLSLQALASQLHRIPCIPGDSLFIHSALTPRGDDKKSQNILRLSNFL